MKNIILVDRELRFVDEIIKKHNIVLLIVDNYNQKTKKYVESKFVKKICTVRELDSMSCMDNLNFEIINKYKHTQLAVENAYLRYTNDYQERKYRYYGALSFFATIFQNNNVDLVIINGLLHGFPYDKVLNDMAIGNGIVSYTINPIGVNAYNRFIYNEKTSEMCLLNNKKIIDMVEDYYKNDKLDVYSWGFQDDSIYSGKFGILKKIIYNLFGAVGVDYVENRFNPKKNTYIASTGFQNNWLDRFKSYYNYCLIKRYMEKKCDKSVDLKAKYIYFSLHYEPEGNTQIRCTLESQLVCIKQLSENLPKDYFIYVKEHPHQFRINKKLFYGCYATNADNFKTKFFYKTLADMPGVVLVPSTYSAEKLMRNSKAVASLLGSCFLEAVVMKKPILIFSELHPLVKARESLLCFSSSMVKKNLEMIKNGYSIKYYDVLDILNNYITPCEEDLINAVNKILDKE